MTYINHVAKVVPDFELTQEKVRHMGRRILKGKVPFLDQALALFTNAGVDHRYLVRDVDEILDHDDLGWRNQVYCQAAVELSERLLGDLLRATDLTADRIDMLITTSCTGFMIPAVDAYLINKFRLRPDVNRLPITELGCAAGAMALSRAHDYLQAHPQANVVVLAVELPSLTYQTRDFRTANLVSAALFGDGGAAALLSNRESPCRILASQTHFFYDTIGYMGFDLNSSGFKILLDKKIPQLIEQGFRKLVDGFLTSHGTALEAIEHFVFHPGGRRIMDTLLAVLELEEHQIEPSRRVLREVGNLSSASVLWVLSEVLKKSKSGEGLMTAFGPGFNAELLLLDFQGQ